MRNVYEVLASESDVFYIAEPVTVKPAGQVLADSDAFAFIYIVEENDQYSYLTFNESLWPLLIDYMKKEQNPSVLIDGELIELESFYDEMTFLLFNIEGNSNYGEAFVERVECVFATILK